MEIETLRELCSAIATALGHPWHSSATPNERRFLLDDGTTFLSVAPENSGKLGVSAWAHELGVPNYLYLYQRAPHIGVSASRGPARIAAEIRRRLLPDATAYLKEITIKGMRWKNELEAVERQVARLLEVSRGGLNRSYHHDPRTIQQSFHWYSNGLHGNITAQGPDRFDITRLSGLTANEATRIVAILSERLLAGKGEGHD